MKIDKLVLILMFTASVAVLTSCGSGGSKPGGGTKKFTSLTGWKPNQKSGWFFTGKAPKEKTWGTMVFVEGGTFTMGAVKDDVMHDWNNTPTRMQVRSFDIGETEVTNYEYREYVTWLKYVFSPNEPVYQHIYSGALPDTTVWGNKLSRNDIYAEEYFRAPQFDYYPVVGVNWLQAQRYCEWLTDRANEKALMDKGVINPNSYEKDTYNADGMSSFTVEKYKYNDPALNDMINKKKFAQQSGITSKNQRIVSVNKSSQGNAVARFRLPSEAEWEYAALGEAGNREYNSVQGKDVMVTNLRGKKGRNRGMFLENFKYSQGDYSGVGGWPNDGNAISSDVKAYPSNGLGIYGMYGNVAEWVEDVYRPIIDTDANDFNYYRGNVFQTYIKSDEGINKITAETMRYDTLADGRVLYSALPGSFQRDVVEDNRSYGDGDYLSSIDAGNGRIDSSGNYNYYNHPRQRWVVDAGSISAGRTGVILLKDPKQRTTDISNTTRVIKGGSWNDTAYWLDPAQRRYMEQNKAASWLGFRVAQDHRGSESSKSKKTKRGVPKKS